MTGTDFKMIRSQYGETQEQFGRRLGWQGSRRVIERKVLRYESGETPIVGTLATLLVLLRDLPKKRR